MWRYIKSNGNTFNSLITHFLQFDLVDEKEQNRALSDDELDDLCHTDDYIGWYSTSAKTGLNVKKGMNFLITQIVRNCDKFKRLQASGTCAFGPDYLRYYTLKSSHKQTRLNLLRHNGQRYSNY